MTFIVKNDFHCWLPVEDPNNFFLDYYSLDEDVLYRQLSEIVIPVRRLPGAGYPFMPNDHPNFGVFFNSTPCVTPVGDFLYNDTYDSMPHPEMLEKWYQDQRYIEKYFMNDDVRNRRECSRCKTKFFDSISGPCYYHIGRLFYNFINPKEVQYSCCNNGKSSDGCVSASDHVWNGLIPGLNGPIDGFVITSYPSLPATKHRVVALDCEMCFTIKGLELTRVTLLNLRGDLIYDTLVMPENPIIDYNTPFSGITKESLEEPGAAVHLREVQKDILQLVDSETIFIGHGLENDLRALKMVHHVVIDTALLYTDSTDGVPGRRFSLKNLSLWYLKRKIQDNECGHDSVEDARACLDLAKHWITVTADHQTMDYTY